MEEVRTLELQLADALQEIEQLKCSKEKLMISQSTPLVKETVKIDDDDSKAGDRQVRQDKPPMTDLQEQQLARYTHFITCPSCKVFDQSTPRNRVVVPCGHLLCTKCASGDLTTCPLCQSPVEGLQTLVIG